MPDRTNEFQSLLKEQKQQGKPRAFGKDKNVSEKEKGQDGLVEDPWETQAERIAKHLLDVKAFIKTIHLAYLAAPDGAQRLPGKGLGRSSRSGSISGSHEKDEKKPWWDAFADLRWLSDREKDEVDMRVTQAWKQAKAQTEDLKTAEAHNRNEGKNRLLSMFSSSGYAASAKALSQHRMTVLVCLNDLLFSVSRMHLDLQTRRRNAAKYRRAGPASSVRGARKNALAEAAAAVPEPMNGNQDPMAAASTSVPENLKPHATSEDIDMLQHLSPSQVQQFESEVEEQVREAHLDLERVNAVRTQLVDISSLQSQLIVNLTLQSEMTDRLYEDALGFTDHVSRANTQLKKAGERSFHGQTLLIIYLLLATVSLIILDIVA